VATVAQTQDAAADVADEGRAFAEAVGRGVEARLSSTLVAASAAVVTAARADTKAGGAVREAVADAAGVLVAMSGPLAEAEADLEAELSAALVAALVAGWRAGVEEQDKLLPDSVRLAGDKVGSEAIGAVLAGWPILGHTAGEVAAHNAATWRFAAAGVLGSAAASGDPGQIVPGLADAARAAGNRATSATAEAFQAGAGAARLAAGEALRRALV
jgi:hypothetical protein